MRIVVVGAGVCGLTLAYNLARAGLPVTILEKENTVGGLARGFQYGDFHFDLGPHRFYSPVTRVMNFITDVLGDDVAYINRSSSVHFLNRYHDWPLRLRSVYQLPPSVSVRAFLDLISKSRQVDRSTPSFENYILGKYGRTLYTLFFRDYTEKFLGIPADGTHANWAKIGVERATIDEKVNTASISHLLKMMLIPKPRELTFVYPPGGVHVFCDRLRQRLVELGADIRLGVVPTSILSADGEIKRVITAEGALEAGYLVWTGPIHQLCALLGTPDPQLRYLSLLLFNIAIRRPTRHKVQWCYYGARDIVFSRISYPNQFHPGMTPPDRGSMCVEVPCRLGDDRWSDPESLLPIIRRDLVKVGAIDSADDIEWCRIEKADYAYPIYDIDYRDKLGAVKRRLEAFSNLALGGRTGLFWYNNMDHSMSNAFQISKKILACALQKDEAVQARRVLQELSEEGAAARLAAAPLG